MLFKRQNRVLFSASVTPNNAALLNGQVVPLVDFAGLVSTCPLDETLWHRRFCHLNKGDVKKLVTGDLVKGVVVKSSQAMDPICEPCIVGKQHRVAVPQVASNRATKC